MPELLRSCPSDRCWDTWIKKAGIDPRLYQAWRSMRRRCRENQHAKNYQDRGIQVCIRWDTFALFAKDMGPHPGKGFSLERKDNDKNYCKQNCKWATATEQGRNRRTNILTERTAAAIRQRFVCGNKWHPGNATELSLEFKCSVQAVYDAAHGISWCSA